MIEIIDVETPGAVGIRVVGKIEEADMDAIIEACEKKWKHVDSLGIYVELRKFGGVSFDALVKDVKFAIPNMKRFHKKAVVSGASWLGKVVEVGDKLFPSIEVRHFDWDERDKALEWIRE